MKETLRGETRDAPVSNLILGKWRFYCTTLVGLDVRFFDLLKTALDLAVLRCDHTDGRHRFAVFAPRKQGAIKNRRKAAVTQKNPAGRAPVTF